MEIGREPLMRSQVPGRVNPPSASLSGDARSSRDLDRSFVSGFVWSGGIRALTIGINWTAAILVVRRLVPADYGLVGMALAYVGLVQMISEFGLGSAVIQRQNLTQIQIARIYGVSVSFGVFLAAVSVAVSGPVASFFAEPGVRNVIVVFSPMFVLGGIQTIPRALLRKDLRFRLLALIQGAENLTYSATSLTLAILGAGYWSLVVGAIVKAVVSTLLILGSCSHPIAWPRGLGSIKGELWFGAHLVLTRMALYVRRFADAVIIGRMLGKDALGVYNVGRTQAYVVVDLLARLISGVAPSILAATQHDVASLRRYLRIVTHGIAFIAFPAAFGMAVVADDFVILFFGERWAAVIAPLRILAFVAATQSITPILSQTLVATDQTKRNLQFGLATALAMPIFIFVGSRWGIVGVAVGWLIGQPLVTGSVLLRHVLRTVGMSLRDYLSALGPATLMSVAMVAAVVAARMAMPDGWPLAGRFAVEVLLGVVTFGLGAYVINRDRFRIFISLLRSGRLKGSPSSDT